MKKTKPKKKKNHLSLLPALDQNHFRPYTLLNLTIYKDIRYTLTLCIYILLYSCIETKVKKAFVLYNAHIKIRETTSIHIYENKHIYI